jgi:hypothetical protein
MSTPKDTPEPSRPGKLRTWWHPLLAGLLRWQLGGQYQLLEEVPVGQKPLQIDLLLLEKGTGELPESVRKTLAGIAEYLSTFTLLEFKSPTDTLRAGDFQTFLAYTLLYRAQNAPLLDAAQMSLLVVAPRVTKPYRSEWQALGVAAEQEQPGIWRLQGGVVVHPMRVLETEVLAGVDHPLLSVFSPQALRSGTPTYQQLIQAGYAELVVYVAQQIRQFRQQGEEFIMQHLGSKEEIAQAWRNLLAQLSPEERLEGLTVEQRLQGLAPEQRLQGLTPEELERLRALLQTLSTNGVTAPPHEEKP